MRTVRVDLPRTPLVAMPFERLKSYELAHLGFLCAQCEVVRIPPDVDSAEEFHRHFHRHMNRHEHHGPNWLVLDAGGRGYLPVYQLRRMN